jgi:hypothetical protein
MTQYQEKADLRREVHELAEEAFSKHLISGFGDGQYADEYQLVIEGKPRHFSLEYARSFLKSLLGQVHDRHAKKMIFRNYSQAH